MRASCTTDERPSSPKGAARSRRSKRMNNAENHAAIEIKRKAAAEEARYEMAERGDVKRQNYEKFDKPDGTPTPDGQHVADSLTQLPPADLRNVGVLALLCSNFLEIRLI